MFEIKLRINGYPLSEAKKKLLKIQQIPETRFEDYVSEQRQKIVNYHIRENPMYQSLVGNNSITQWLEVPVMLKSDLQKPLQERLSNGFPKKKVMLKKNRVFVDIRLFLLRINFFIPLHWPKS